MANINETTNPYLNTQRATENLTERSYQNDLSQISSSNMNGLAVTYTNIFIRSNNINVGMIQSFNTTESRTINKLQAIGVEGVIQAVPQNTNGGSISASRVALYGERLYDAFKFKTANDTSIFKTLKDQRTPFEIQVLTVSGTKSDGSASFYTETYVDCWLNSYKKNYTVSNITVSEEVGMVYADVM